LAFGFNPDVQHVLLLKFMLEWLSQNSALLLTSIASQPSMHSTLCIIGASLKWFYCSAVC